MRADASFWDRWGVARYLSDRFERLYWWNQALVSAILPLLQPKDAVRLQADSEAVEKHFETWLARTEQLAGGLRTEDLPESGRRALKRLQAATFPK
ncbi:MAG: hypothetical protein ACREM9_02070 [Gemmatimonadales bacterium]